MESQVSLVKKGFEDCGFSDAGFEVFVKFVDVVSECWD